MTVMLFGISIFLFWDLIWRKQHFGLGTVYTIRGDQVRSLAKDYQFSFITEDDVVVTVKSPPFTRHTNSEKGTYLDFSHRPITIDAFCEGFRWSTIEINQDYIDKKIIPYVIGHYNEMGINPLKY